MSAAEYHLSIEGDIVVLVDVGGSRRSITNDAEAVVADVALMMGDDLTGKRIIYRDTMQRWDGLAHRGDRFIGFVSLNETDRGRAIEAARAHPNWPT